MVNPTHLAILEAGESEWNKWRVNNPAVQPDLTHTSLSKKSLRNFDLSNCLLSFSDCRDVSFRRSNLVGADFESAKLYRAFFSGCEMEGATFRNAIFYETVFANVDLTSVHGLTDCKHKGPSVVDHRTLTRSRSIPIEFLRGCGLPDFLIAETSQQDSNPRKFSSCFISYASADQPFAERLYDDLQSNGVRCWYAPKSMPIGAKIRDTIDEAIQDSGKVLLILSSNSISSEWVEAEFETAVDEERRRKQPVLFPIRLDDSHLSEEHAWISAIRRKHHIGDFSAWRDSERYGESLKKLLDALANYERSDASQETPSK